MDVMRPDVRWIDGRCYRINPSMADSHPFTDDGEDNSDLNQIDDELNEERYDSAFTCESDVNIEQDRGGGYRLELDVPTAYYKYIIGKKGEIKRQVEQETKTQIRIPKMGQEGNIVITSSSSHHILSFKSRLDLIVQSARRKQPFTHFLSIPFTSPEMIQGFTRFTKDVMEKCSEDAGVESSLFQSPHKLHLTIGTLVLLSGRERDQAAKLLHQCVNDVIRPITSQHLDAHEGGPGGLLVDVRGVEYMNDDPGEVDVLYAKVISTPHNVLQSVCDGVVERFVSAGLMLPDSETVRGGCGSPGRVKLHVTVMNTLFRRGPGPAADPAQDPAGPQSEADHYLASGGGQRERTTFNATHILKLFSEFPFATSQHIDTIHLSQRYSTAPDGYYTPTATAHFT